MSTITIPDPDDEFGRALDALAKKNGTSRDEEARNILRVALKAPPDLGLAIRRRFGPLGGVDLPDPIRPAIAEPSDLD